MLKYVPVSVITDNIVMTSCRTNPQKSRHTSVRRHIYTGAPPTHDTCSNGPFVRGRIYTGAPPTHDTCSNGPFVRGLSACEGYLRM